MWRKKRFLWSVLCCGLLSLGCVKGSRAQSKKPHASKKENKSINARFLSKKLDVKRWKKTFSSHGREVWRYRHQIVSRMGLRTGMSVADVGAGTGAFLEVLRKPLLPGGKLYLVDISPGFIKMLRERVKKQKWKDVFVVQNTERSVKLPKASVDLIFTSDTYHHFEHVKETLASIHRALRPKGHLVIVDFERIPGVTRSWIMEHVKHGKAHVIKEVQQHGFVLLREEKIPQLKENYVLVFRRR